MKGRAQRASGELIAQSTERAVRPPPAISPERLVRTCLNCGTELEERKCKLFCKCGYYASCSDFY